MATPRTRRVVYATKQRRGKVAPDVLKDIVARVVAAAKPEKIILFGSAARGTMGPNSDVDLLVIKAGKYDKWRMTDTIRHGFYGVEAAIDVIVVTPEEVEEYRDCPYVVICPALREGRVIYGA